MEWNFPVWFASLDLKKAFDRIEYSSLFGALQSQGVSRPYLKLLAALYCNQTGDVTGNTFRIQRGVKKGDVISHCCLMLAWNMPCVNGNFVCNTVVLILETANI